MYFSIWGYDPARDLNRRHGDRIFAVTGMHGSKWSVIRDQLEEDAAEQEVRSSTAKRPPSKHQVPRKFADNKPSPIQKTAANQTKAAKPRRTPQTYDNATFLNDEPEVKSEEVKHPTTADDIYVVIESTSENGNNKRDRRMSIAANRDRGHGVDVHKLQSNKESQSEKSNRREQTKVGKGSELLHQSKSENVGTWNNSEEGKHVIQKREQRNNQSNISKSADSIKHKSAQSLHPSTLRNVVYYQNRFIVLDSNDGGNSRSPNSSSRANLDAPKKAMADQTGQFLGDDETETTFTKVPFANNRGRTRHMEMDATSVTMDARGIDIILTDPENTSKNITSDSYKKDTVLRKIHRLLLDNRMKGKPPLETTGNPEEYRVLKKVLNISFLTIGIVLFIAVVVVVIYAFIVGDEMDAKAEAEKLAKKGNA